MQLKEYQQNALATIRAYFEYLADLQRKAEKITDPDLKFDFCEKAWEKTGIVRPYVRHSTGHRKRLPAFCIKVPTGGGKTLLAVKTIDLANMVYLRRKTGLVLWIVPTTQIYRQTIQSLKDRDHPYRQHLDMASGGRTVILEKGERFSREEIAENLVILMLMLPSANRKTKETLKVFKDSGGFQSFFPAEDDVRGQEDLLNRYPNLDTYEKISGFWGRQIKTSLGNTLRLLSPLVILDEGHKAYSEGAQETLRGFNPCMIVELSATPLSQSNILVDIKGRDLHREEMIKLDLHVVNKVSPDWKATLLEGFNKRQVLEDKAREYEANTDVRIRPICLIQVERTGKDQIGGKFIHSEQVREQLIKHLGVPADEIAIKSSEKDELKEVDDVGGLLARDCKIRYIITKQALQEGWDCSFAYVLVILTNPSSKNSLTQLVGRILRQPFARKTHLRELDESYVYCFQQKGRELLDSIKTGFESEGLGDLRGHITAETDGAGGGEPSHYSFIREQFKAAAARTFLPVFVLKDSNRWRPVNYEMDIESQIPWGEADIRPVLELTLSFDERVDIETGISLIDDKYRVIDGKVIRAQEDAGIQVDPVFMTRQIADIVPNPWKAHEFSTSVLVHFLAKGGGGKDAEQLITNNFVFLIGELRKRLDEEKDRLAEAVFRRLLEEDKLRFLIIAESLKWTFPKSIPMRETDKPLTRKFGQPLQVSLFEIVPDGDFNDSEKLVAWYLEGQHRMFFWYRNRARHDYSIQGWKQHRIYPDFIFTTHKNETGSDCERVYVVELKGKHLMGNVKSDYLQKIYGICTKHAKLYSPDELELKMKDKKISFEFLPEDEWEGKLNAMLQS